MSGIPPAKATDAEDVVWGLQTAETLWKRGERIDALVWLRRAAQSASDASDDDRALELARFAAELTELVASQAPPLDTLVPPGEAAPGATAKAPSDAAPSSPPAEAARPLEAALAPRLPSQPVIHQAVELPPADPHEREPLEANEAPPDGAGPPLSVEEPGGRASATSVPPADKVHAGIFDPWAEQATNMPQALKAPPAPTPPPPDFQDEEIITSVRPQAMSQHRSDAPAKVPSLPAQPAAPAATQKVQPAKPAESAPKRPPGKPPPLPPRALQKSPPQKPSPPRVASTPSPPARGAVVPPPLPAEPRAASAPPMPAAPRAPSPSAPRVASAPPMPAAPRAPSAPKMPIPPPPAELMAAMPPPEPIGATEPTPRAPIAEPEPPTPALELSMPEPPTEEPTEQVRAAPSTPQLAPPEPSAPETLPPETPAPETPLVTSSELELVPAGEEGLTPREPPVAASEEAKPAPIPAAAPAQALEKLELDDVDAFADLPDDARTAFAAAASVHAVAEGEEVSSFALAFIVSGSFDVAATVVDAPALRLAQGAVLRARGTTEDGVPMRLISASGNGVLATWSDAAVEEAFRTIPWVEEDLRAAADRVQTLVGITIGPLGERLDASIREQILGRLTMRPFGPSEIVVKAGDPVPGLLLVGVGELELVQGETVSGVIGSGEFLFPTEVLGAGSAPVTARAGSGGALVMFGDRLVAQELLVTCPPLLEVFAGM
jgi:hypothetical protein